MPDVEYIAQIIVENNTIPSYDFTQTGEGKYQLVDTNGRAVGSLYARKQRDTAGNAVIGKNGREQWQYNVMYETTFGGVE